LGSPVDRISIVVGFWVQLTVTTVVESIAVPADEIPETDKTRDHATLFLREMLYFHVVKPELLCDEPY
jgi:hypothetical protein